MSKRAGFSLFELLMVLALLAVLAGLALQGARVWTERTKIDRANGAVVELVSEARRRAVNDGSAWVIQYSNQTQKLTLKPERPSIHNSPSKKAELEEERLLDENIQIEFLSEKSGKSLKSIRVTPLGSITPADIRVLRGGILQQAFRTERLTGNLRRVL